jgi:hypothetical protein
MAIYMKYYVDSLKLKWPRRFTKILSGHPPGKAAHHRHAGTLAIALFAVSMVFAPGTAWAVIVPAGQHTFDGNLPGNLFVSFDGTKFATPLVAPTATFGVSIDSGALHQDYPVSSFNIETGFVIGSVFVFDPTLSGVILPGDPIFASMGPGKFDITDGAGKILTGQFTSATLTSTVGASAASLSASNINGLVLTHGPAFTFDTSSVSSILASPTGFSISLSSIPGGVTAVQNGPEIGQFIPALLSAFAPSSGSAVVSGKFNVVPEPSTIFLAGSGCLMLLGLGWKRLRGARPSGRPAA